MLWIMLKCSLLLLSVACSLCDGQDCLQGDVILTANECTEPDEIFNSTASVLPGSNITLTCSVLDSTVRWSSNQFAMSVRVDLSEKTANESGIVFQYDTLSTNPTCSNATATIANIQESMDGLDLTCFNVLPPGFTSTVLFNVIGPPPAVNFTANQSVNEIVILWTILSGHPCPIKYIININGDIITINGSDVEMDGNGNEIRLSVDDKCGSTLEISMYATGPSGTGEITTTNLAIVAAPANLSLCAVKEFLGSSAKGLFLNAEWKMPLNVSSEIGLIIEVNSTAVPSPLDASTTMYMYQIEDGTFPGKHDVMVYFEGQSNSTCFSTSNQITIPNEFPTVTVFESTIGSEEAHFILMINSAFTVTNDSLTLSGGNSGQCVLGMDQLSPSVEVTCNSLTAERYYNLTIDISVGGNCLMILIRFVTPRASIPTGSSSGTSTMFSSMTTSTKPVSSTPTGTMTTSSMAGPTTTGASDLALTVGIPVVVVVAVLAIISLVMIFLICHIQKRKRKVSLGHAQEAVDGDGSPIALVEKPAKDPKTGEVGTYDGSNGQEKEVLHQQGPTGDEYAVVDKPATRRAAPSTPQFEPMTYQDPHTIQRQEAPTGDLYALPQNKGKEPKESMPVYSEVNKQPDRVYADLALPKGGDSGVNRQQPSQEGFVMYSEILPSGAPPRPPKPQESTPEVSLYSEIQQPPPPPSPLAEQDSMVDVPEEESLYEKHQSN